MNTHPLDPLNETEIAKAADIVNSHANLDDSAWFETITLKEPDKEQLNNVEPERIIERRAYVCCYEPVSNRTFSGIANIESGRLESWNHIPGVQARIVTEEFAAGENLVKADTRFLQACARRGITDMSKVLVETWSAGNFGIEEELGENLHPVVDLRRREVIRIDDFGVIDIPPDSAPIRPTENLRTDVKPLSIAQPEGPSFKVDGFQVEWQKWNLRIGFNTREGLVLHSISYLDKDRKRPIMHRMSMPEMVVPYGDPSPGNFRRNAFDTGEYGIGLALDSLTLGCDCLGHIHYFDICAHDWSGKPKLIKNAICMHEEDYGILWKHTDARTGKMRAVRSRRLVISSICTIGNYVYGFYYYFYQDGTIGVEVKATGIPFPTAIASGKESKFGSIVAPGIQSHVHQHVFCFRFDMCVDGENNSVSEVEFASSEISPKNPHGNAVEINERTLHSESEAQREINLSSSRYWKVSNPDILNQFGKPTAYATLCPFCTKIQPSANELVLCLNISGQRNTMPIKCIPQVGTPIRVPEMTVYLTGPKLTVQLRIQMLLFGTR